MKSQENDVVLCTVKRIEKTTVFLNIEGGEEGTMIFSEVSAGRIRNIREYIRPNQKVVCKVLRIKGENIELSLRRVTAREKSEVLDEYKKEKTLRSILNPVLKERTKDSIDKIKEMYTASEFFDEVRENPKLIEKFVLKKDVEKLKKIFVEKKEKDKIVKKTFVLKSDSSDGLLRIKEILNVKNVLIYYLGSSKFSIEFSAQDYKTANASLDKIISGIKERSKKLGVKVEVK